MKNKDKEGTVSNKIKKTVSSVKKKGKNIAKGLWKAATTPEGKYYGPTGNRYITSGPEGVKPSATKKTETKKPETKRPATKQREKIDLGQKLEPKGPSIIKNNIDTSLKRATPKKIEVDAKTKFKMEKEIKRTDKKVARAQKRYERTKSESVATKQRAKREALKDRSSQLKEEFSHIAAKGGPIKKQSDYTKKNVKPVPFPDVKQKPKVINGKKVKPVPFPEYKQKPKEINGKIVKPVEMPSPKFNVDTTKYKRKKTNINNMELLTYKKGGKLSKKKC